MVWIKDPNSVMPMRKMTNAEGRAAAERNKARQSKFPSHKQPGAKTNPSGVKQ